MKLLSIFNMSKFIVRKEKVRVRKLDWLEYDTTKFASTNKSLADNVLKLNKSNKKEYLCFNGNSVFSALFKYKGWRALQNEYYNGKIKNTVDMKEVHNLFPLFFYAKNVKFPKLSELKEDESLVFYYKQSPYAVLRRDFNLDYKTAEKEIRELLTKVKRSSHTTNNYSGLSFLMDILESIEDAQTKNNSKAKTLMSTMYGGRIEVDPYIGPIDSPVEEREILQACFDTDEPHLPLMDRVKTRTNAQHSMNYFFNARTKEWQAIDLKPKNIYEQLLNNSNY